MKPTTSSPATLLLAVLVVSGLLVIHSILLLDSLQRDFVTIDEAAHVAAGISHWETGTYSMYRVNPPLPRMLAVVPVLLAKPSTAGILPSDSPGDRAEWQSGQQFAVANSDKYLTLVCLARLAGVGWSVLGGLLVFLWARELYGEVAGCLALALWSFEPTILAFAHITVPDVPATVAGLAATYAIWHYLRSPSLHGAFLAGLLLGIAQLTKFTLLLLYGLWPILWLVFQFSSTKERGHPKTRLRTSAAHGLLIVAMSLFVINLGYGFQGSFRPLGQIPFVSDTFTGERLDQNPSGNCFRNSWLAPLPVPLPEDFLRGIDVQRRDFEVGIRSYLAGVWQPHGWWYYYLYALAVKVPLGTWGLVLWGIVLTLSRHPSSAPWRDELTLWLPAMAVLVLVSSQTGFNHHMRYVLPMFPFVLISTSKLAYFLQPARWQAGLVVVVLVGWSMASTLFIHPHYMSHFNELAGGPDNGHAHLVDSNIDWGQDLLFLKKWLDAHPEARPLGLAYFNMVDPSVIGLEFTLPPYGPTSEDLPQDQAEWSRLGPQPGYYAISVNLLRGVTYAIPNGKGNRVGLPGQAYEYFRHFQPIARAGFSIYIYHITVEEANRVRQQYGLPPVSEPLPLPTPGGEP